MAIPDGFDLFKYAYPRVEVDVKAHPLYPAFVSAARELGYEVESGGFQDYEDAYFGFFLAGVAAGREAT